MDIYQWNKKYSEISNRYNALYRNVAAHFGFSDCQFKILYNLYINRSGTTQNKLAYDFCLSKQTVNSAVMKLMDMKLIELSKGTDAKNSKRIFLTDKGLETGRKCIEPLIDAEISAIGKIDDEQLRRFFELFELQYTMLEKEINRLVKEEK